MMKRWQEFARLVHGRKAVFSARWEELARLALDFQRRDPEADDYVCLAAVAVNIIYKWCNRNQPPANPLREREGRFYDGSIRELSIMVSDVLHLRGATLAPRKYNPPSWRAIESKMVDALEGIIHASYVAWLRLEELRRES